MFRIGHLFALLALLFASAQAETIVSDSLGNSIGLPLGGGNATGHITNTNSMVSTSPYTLSVYINNGENNGVSPPPSNVPGTIESFYFNPPSNNGLYGNATLVRSGYSRQFTTSNIQYNTTAGEWLGTPAQPTNETGLYQFYFTIPVLGAVLVNVTYINSGAPFPVVDLITIYVTNPSVVVGDPQFVGLRGQSFQVHGIDGAIYNIISQENTQVNARFTFLSEGECPVVNGRHEPNCWSHPGSYLGEMSFQAKADGKLHQVLISAGSAHTGFASIQLDGKSLRVGDSYTFGEFSLSVKSAYRVAIQTETFSFELSNSDMFINQAVSARVPLSKINAHGLLGQTAKAKVYPSALRYIEGEVDDYVIADNDIFGSDFAFNRF